MLLAAATRLGGQGDLEALSCHEGLVRHLSRYGHEDPEYHETHEDHGRPEYQDDQDRLGYR